jgi:hypothetical protein
MFDLRHVWGEKKNSRTELVDVLSSGPSRRTVMSCHNVLLLPIMVAARGKTPSWDARLQLGQFHSLTAKCETAFVYVVGKVLRACC